jgi:phasin family protein
MSIQNDPFTQFLGFQKEALEPIRAANVVAADAFERLSRQNYAVIGDYVNFFVEQARLPAKTTDINEYLTQQMEHARAFGEQLVRRSQEYVEIAGAFQAKAQAAITPVATKTKAA